MEDNLIKSIDDCIAAAKWLRKEESIAFIKKAADMLCKCFSSGHKIIIAGNGGSLCDAMHFAEELTGFFRKRRKPLPAIALSDPGHLTCVSNDLSFGQVFARGLEAFYLPGDIFIGLSTSGNSQNIVEAFKQAKTLQSESIAFLGGSGGLLKGVADLEFVVEGFTGSDRIQEVHMAAIHLIIELIESRLF